MLSWSGLQNEAEIDLGAVAAGHGDAGIARSNDLLRFATAAASMRGDTTEIDAARAALVESTDREFMIDAAAVAANFHMMTRLADATGARYPATRLDDMATTIERMGNADMISRR